MWRKFSAYSPVVMVAWSVAKRKVKLLYSKAAMCCKSQTKGVNKVI